MTKKTIFFTSLIGTVAAFSTGGLTMFKFWCGPTNYACWDKLEIISSLFLIFIPTLIISIVTYFLREEVFKTWRNFTFIWVPLTVAVVFFIPESELRGLFFDISKGEVALILSFFFAVISLILIVVKSLLLRGK